MERAEKLAVRAINQYRRRDILPYMGLRYYLENLSTRRDRWAHEVSTHLVRNRLEPTYYEANHFKDVYSNGTVHHRKMHLPGPNEAIAEAALMEICSQYPEQFNSLDCVYSYRLAKGNQRDGVFEPYFNRLKERHKAVARACHDTTDGIVRYLDIKRFYPNISTELAKRVWSNACDHSQFPALYRELGEKLLDDHINKSGASGEKEGLLTGPVFSHLIANLVLHGIDEKMHSKIPGRYFRYVDDMIMVGSEKEVSKYRALLSDLLEELPLELHDGSKDFVVHTTEWLHGEYDFEDNGEKPSWMTLIGSIKRYLAVYPNASGVLTRLFAEDGFRIPIPEYQADIQESNYIDRFRNYSKNKWIKYQMRKINVEGLLSEAWFLREKYERQLVGNLNGIDTLVGYERKRRIPKLRFSAGRMVYLATIEQLSRYFDALKGIPETRLQGEIFDAVAKRDVSSLVEFGINAVQSAAQVLRLDQEVVKCAPRVWNEPELQGLSILKLNGVLLDIHGLQTETQHDLLRFSDRPGEDASLMRSNNVFVSELASLHGREESSRHSRILNSAFDPGEDMAFDAINQLNPMSY